MAFFQVVVLDLDGTIASRGKLSTKALDAIDQVRRDGVTVILATGRIATELDAEFPHLSDHFDALVLENGGVAVVAGTARALAISVDGALYDALTDRGVPHRRGQVLGAVDGEHATTVLAAIGELGLDCQLVRNRESLMVLPAGVTKGTGLRAVLGEMNLSAHNTIAVGDAENDLAMFGVAEVGAAVVNAVPSVRERADLILDAEDGDARRAGYVLSSFAPASLPADEIDGADIVLELGHEEASSGVEATRVLRATLRAGTEPARSFTVAARRTTHIRHRHKYADVSLPAERQFCFRAVAGQYVPPATTMHDFGAALKHLDPHALRYHLERGDFSRWLDGTIADEGFATQVAAWEDELLAHEAADLERIRHRLIQGVEERYLDP